MAKKLSERLVKWIRAQKCRGADSGWRYLMVELAQRVEVLFEAVESEDTPALDERTIVKLAYELSEAQAEIERLRPLADIGEKVWSMELGARLTKACTSRYWSERQCGETWVSVGPQVAMLSPTEALRAIQEVADGCSTS